MSLRPQDIQGRRVCVISGKFVPTYASVRVDEHSGQIGLVFDAAPGLCEDATQQKCSEVKSAAPDVPPFASLHWYQPELLARIYEVKPNDLEFGLGCPFAVKEKDLNDLLVSIVPGTLLPPSIKSDSSLGPG